MCPSPKNPRKRENHKNTYLYLKLTLTIILRDRSDLIGPFIEMLHYRFVLPPSITRRMSSAAKRLREATGDKMDHEIRTDNDNRNSMMLNWHL